MATRRKKPIRRTRCKKKPCNLLDLGRRRVKALAKSRGKKPNYKKYTQSQLRKIGRSRLKSVRKYNKKR